MSDFDERLHDLRKYGFTFITALLTAESILIPGPVEAAFQQPAIPDRIKLAVMLVTLLLLGGIRLMDKYYRLFLDAADIRAKIIERSLNLELSDAITFRFRIEKFSSYVNWLYYLFGGATGLLSVFILYPNILAVLGVLVSTEVYAGVVWRIDNLKNSLQLQDWTIDQLEVKQGDDVHITLTNLESKSVILNTGDICWSVMPQGRYALPDVVYVERSDKTIIILGDDSYTWTLYTKNLEPGVYGVLPYNRKEPLKRKITIQDASFNTKIAPVKSSTDDPKAKAPQPQTISSERSSDGPISVLKVRFAKGEIDKNQYEEMLKIIT
jgi:hypothetical protein